MVNNPHLNLSGFIRLKFIESPVVFKRVQCYDFEVDFDLQSTPLFWTLSSRCTMRWDP